MASDKYEIRSTKYETNSKSEGLKPGDYSEVDSEETNHHAVGKIMHVPPVIAVPKGDKVFRHATVLGSESHATR